jgi:hypothetical protein
LRTLPRKPFLISSPLRGDESFSGGEPQEIGQISDPQL